MDTDTSPSPVCPQEPNPTEESSISVLPEDILFHIFKTLVLSYNAPVHMPIILSHVSSRWREITRSPRFWTKIQVQGTLASIHSFSKTLSRTKHFLMLSGGLELDVTITIRTIYKCKSMFDDEHAFYLDTNAFRQYTRSLSALLSKHISRLRHFKLTTDEFDSILDVQNQLPHAPMPLLETWEINHDDETMGYEATMEGYDPSIISIPLQLPHATKANVMNMYPKLISVELLATPIALSQFAPRNLRYLKLSSLPMEQRPTMAVLREILLANEHSLEKLALIAAVPPGDDSLPPFVLSKLTTLSLGFIHAGELIPLIRCMGVPNLMELRLIDHHRYIAFRSGNLMEDHETTFPLLTVIMEYLPLSQLRKLLLGYFQFRPPPSSEVEWMTNNLNNTSFPALSFLFFSSLTSVDTLILVYPDIASIYTLNYLPLNPTTDTPKGPVPNLEHLYFALFTLPEVQHFFRTRLIYHQSFRKLKMITCGMPKGWMQYLNFRLNLLGNSICVQNMDICTQTEKRLMNGTLNL